MTFYRNKGKSKQAMSGAGQAAFSRMGIARPHREEAGAPTSPAPFLLEACHIDRSFGDKKVLEDVNLQVEEGRAVSLLGLSGSGKTSLFHILAGLDMPDRGQVFYQGREVTGKAGHLAYMLQKDLLFKHMTVVDNVCLPLVISGVPKKEARAQAQQYFHEFGLAGTEDLYPFALSGGMAQRAAFLRTFLFSRELMLLDEPFSRLDAITRLQLEKWFLGICQKYGITSLLITHDIDQAMRLSELIYVLDTRTHRLTKPFILPPLDQENREKELKKPEAKALRRAIERVIEQDLAATTMP